MGHYFDPLVGTVGVETQNNEFRQDVLSAPPAMVFATEDSLKANELDRTDQLEPLDQDQLEQLQQMAPLDQGQEDDEEQRAQRAQREELVMQDLDEDLEQAEDLEEEEGQEQEEDLEEEEAQEQDQDLEDKQDMMQMEEAEEEKQEMEQEEMQVEEMQVEAEAAEEEEEELETEDEEDEEQSAQRALVVMREMKQQREELVKIKKEFKEVFDKAVYATKHSNDPVWVKNLRNDMQSLKDGIENADEKIGTEDLETELEEIQEMLNDIRTAADVEQEEHEAKLLTEVQVYCLHCNGNHDDSMFLLCAKGGRDQTLSRTPKPSPDRTITRSTVQVVQVVIRSLEAFAFDSPVIASIFRAGV